MVRLNGGTFTMGTDSDIGYAEDGEGPARSIHLDPFYIDVTPVTKRDFAAFVKATNYVTEAEKFGWSFVFHNQLASRRSLQSVAGPGMVASGRWGKLAHARGTWQ